MASPERRRKKSYLNSRNREKGAGIKRASDVKQSISQFLDSAQTEDLLFNAGSSPKTRQSGVLSSSIHATPSGNKHHGLSFKSHHISKAAAISPTDGEENDEESFNQSRREMPFNHRTSVRKSPSHVKPKLKRKHPKRRQENSARQAKTDFDDDEDDEDLQSFAVDNGDDDDMTISSNEDIVPRSRPRTKTNKLSQHQRSSSQHHRDSSRSSRSTRMPPSRSLSHNSKLDSSSRQSPKSRLAPRRSQSMRSSNSSIAGKLSHGLGTLDRHSRRARMKQDYRNHSQRHGRSDDDDDGGNSVASGLSTMSTRTRSRSSGLEGGALNAFLGDEHIARNASRGKGFSPGGMVAQADEKFMRARKSRQDLIMDVALKDKLQFEAKVREEAETTERINNSRFDSDSSHEDGLRFGKKKGMFGNLKRAARKSAKMTKSGAKGTVNVVKDPKRAAKKVRGFAKDVGKVRHLWMIGVLLS